VLAIKHHVEGTLRHALLIVGVAALALSPFLTKDRGDTNA